MTRLGVDLGGSKIEAAVLAADGRALARVRRRTPSTYAEALEAVAAAAAEAETAAGCGPIARIGVGMPGCVSRRDGLVRHASALWLNGRPFAEDLARVAGRVVRLANDANCFALSEARDGAGAAAEVVFGLILGTGCGGGVVVRGRLVEGASRLAGEIGHTPLPWPDAEERGAPPCWCGRRDCLEGFVSGPAFARDYARASGLALEPSAVLERVRAGEAAAGAVFDRYVDRLARGLGVACALLDPDVVVLGGGLSNVPELYDRLPRALAAASGAEQLLTRIERARHGDSSGVRGAAWLWEGEA